MKKKQIPLRKCVACNENKPKKELIRIVKNKEGKVEVDLTGKKNGRGTYICSSIDCLEDVKKSNKFSKTLQAEIPDEVYNNLFEIIEHNED